MDNSKSSELTRDEYTEYIYSEICFGNPLNTKSAEDVEEGVKRAIELENEAVFIEGLVQRLNQLGFYCKVDNTEEIVSEIKNRFKTILKKPCPKAVINWIKGVTPGFTNRINNYDLCYALEMDCDQTGVFFQKYYLTIPFICKSRTDAVFLYCLYHKKDYSVVQKLLDASESFVSQVNAHTSTSQISCIIKDINDDDEFFKYLSMHCYNNKQQFQLARAIINKEIDMVKADILRQSGSGAVDVLSPNRLNSLTVDALLGYRYQSSERKQLRDKLIKLPKHFTESLLNDTTIGKIINGDEVSYEVLRKALMLLKFYNFYANADNETPNKIGGNLMDFFDELNIALEKCGFAQIYMRHPFDCLLLYCANSYDPILTFQYLNEYGRN